MSAPVKAEAQAHRRAGRAEREARDRVALAAGTIRGRVLQMLVEAGEVGLTAWEAWKLYNEQTGEDRELYSIAPRLSELSPPNGVYAEQTGSFRRPTPTRPRREVYRATEAGRLWVQQEKAKAKAKAEQQKRAAAR